jgi:hypothetical protein
LPTILLGSSLGGHTVPGLPALLLVVDHTYRTYHILHTYHTALVCTALPFVSRRPLPCTHLTTFGQVFPRPQSQAIFVSAPSVPGGLGHLYYGITLKFPNDIWSLWLNWFLYCIQTQLGNTTLCQVTRGTHLSRADLPTRRSLDARCSRQGILPCQMFHAHQQATTHTSQNNTTSSLLILAFLL